MFGASLWFILLAIFYYEYVPEDAFAEQEAALKAPEVDEEKLEDETTKVNEAFESDEKTNAETADL